MWAEARAARVPKVPVHARRALAYGGPVRTWHALAPTATRILRSPCTHTCTCLLLVATCNASTPLNLTVLTLLTLLTFRSSQTLRGSGANQLIGPPKHACGPRNENVLIRTILLFLSIFAMLFAQLGASNNILSLRGTRFSPPTARAANYREARQPLRPCTRRVHLRCTRCPRTRCMRLHLTRLTHKATPHVRTRRAHTLDATSCGKLPPVRSTLSAARARVFAQTSPVRAMRALA